MPWPPVAFTGLGVFRNMSWAPKSVHTNGLLAKVSTWTMSVTMSAHVS